MNRIILSLLLIIFFLLYLNLRLEKNRSIESLNSNISNINLKTRKSTYYASKENEYELPPFEEFIITTYAIYIR